jgi:parallel beta-helix repeat protein
VSKLRETILNGIPEFIAEYYKKSADIIVGSSTAGHTLRDAHYICDGVDDQVEINAAIQALPASGGKVLLNGEFNVTGNVLINKPNVILQGMGRTTIIKGMEGNYSVTDGILCALNTSNVQIESLCVNGNAIKKHAIKLNSIDGGKVVDCLCHNSGVYGICVLNSNCISVEGCKSYNNGEDGICFNNSNNCIVKNCLCYNNSVHGIRFGIASKNCIVCNSFCNANVYGISIYENTDYNKYIIVSGNICKDNDHGIWVKSSNTLVDGNIIYRGTGLPADYSSSQYTIYLSAGANNNLITDNSMFGKNYVDSSGSTSNTFADNKYN